MRCACKSVLLIAFVALLTAGPAFTQAVPTEELSKAAAVAPPAAFVYVQTTKGVNVYDASTAGKLTLVKGSPFATVGQMEGINGKYLVSVGTDYLRTYAIESNGTVGKQASETNTQDYDGSECGNTTGNGAILDHDGKYLYVSLNTFGSPGNCDAWQSYQITSNGDLVFLGDVEAGGYIDGWATGTTTPTISSNDMFGYGITTSYVEGTEFNQSAISPFARTGGGVLQSPENFTETDPVGNPNMVGGPNFTAGGWYPTLVKADPTGHLAALMFESHPLAGPFDPPMLTSPQLASYIINDATGSVVSTNTWLNMPTPKVHASLMAMSPSGRILVLAGNGLQLFHFNGAAPITTYSGLLLPSVNIDQLAWDNSNHLYALSYASGKLYVYTVTPTSISEVAGSPYSVANAYGIKGLIVVPKL